MLVHPVSLIVVSLIVFQAIHPAQPQSSGNPSVLHRTNNPDGSSTVFPEPQRCYEYTWKGPVNDKFNETDQSTCGSLNQKGMPCFHPFVWTYGEYQDNQPLPEVIAKECETGDVNGNQCDPTCSKNANTCIKMTYFVRGTDNIDNATSFCGKGVSTNNGMAIKTGCYTEDNQDNSGYDVEVCFCDTPLCNGAECLITSFHNIILMPLIMMHYFSYVTFSMLI